MNKPRLFQSADEISAEQASLIERFQRGGGDGTGGGMDERVIRLESDVARLKDDVGQLRADVGSLKTDVATLKENVRHLPTKAELHTTVDSVIEKAAGRVQRNVAIGGTILAALIGIASNWSRIAG